MAVSLADKRRVARWIHMWRRRLLLQDWNVNVAFSETQPENQRYAEIVTDHPYQQMEITIYPRFWSAPRSEQSLTLAHELMHALTDELYELGRRKRRVSEPRVMQAVERLTEHMASVLWAAYN